MCHPCALRAGRMVHVAVPYPFPPGGDGSVHEAAAKPSAGSECVTIPFVDIMCLETERE